MSTEFDEKYVGKIKRWSKLNKCGNHIITFVTKEDSGKTHSGLSLQLPAEAKIKNCHIVLVLVGNDNNRHPWLEYHRYAIQLKKPIMYLRIPYTTDPIPQRFAYLAQIAFNPNAIDKLVRDYKHRYEQYLLRIRQEQQQEQQQEESAEMPQPLTETEVANIDNKENDLGAFGSI